MEEDFEIFLDDEITALCAVISFQLNEFAEKLGLERRVWYLTVAQHRVIKVDVAHETRPRLFRSRYKHEKDRPFRIRAFLRQLDHETVDC